MSRQKKHLRKLEVHPHPVVFADAGRHGETEFQFRAFGGDGWAFAGPRLEVSGLFEDVSAGSGGSNAEGSHFAGRCQAEDAQMAGEIERIGVGEEFLAVGDAIGVGVGIGIGSGEVEAAAALPGIGHEVTVKVLRADIERDATAGFGSL